VVGPAGSGKTTVAAALARQMGVAHIELDAIFHQPGWTELEPDEFSARVGAQTRGDAWVVDGNYSVVREKVWARADSVVWLDLGLPVVAVRIVARTVGRVVRRTELWNGNREPASNLWSLRPQHSIIMWSLSRHSLYRRRYAEAARDPRWSHLTFIRLRTRRQVAMFLHGLPVAAPPTSAFDLDLDQGVS
jgi:adenylate kinase family enzyme